MKISLQQFNGSSTVMVVGEYTCKFTLLFANDFQENDQIRKDRSTDRETQRVIERENWKRSCSVWKWITRLLYVQCHEEAFQETDDLIWIFTRPLICAAAIGGPSRFLHLLLPFFYRRLGDWGSFISFPANVSFVFFLCLFSPPFLVAPFWQAWPLIGMWWTCIWWRNDWSSEGSIDEDHWFLFFFFHFGSSAGSSRPCTCHATRVSQTTDQPKLTGQ